MKGKKMVILFVVLTIIIAITIEQLIVKSRKLTGAQLISGVPVFNKSSIYAPEGYLLSGYHTWALPVDKAVKVGIDNFAVKALGNILIDNITVPGKTVHKGDKIIEAEVHGRKLNFRSPVNGTVKAVNKNLLNRKVNDAYGDDWGLIIEIPENSEDLLSGSRSQQWLKKELRLLKDFLSENSFTPEAVGVTMYDGGNIVEGVLSKLNGDVIRYFEEQFLSGNNA